MKIWWIDEPDLAGSPNPIDDELKSLRDQGFVAIICLLEDEQEEPLYSVVDAQAIEYSWSSIPVRDFAAPTLEQLDQFLRLVEDERMRGKVLVHCQGGLGRTGTMAAAYWIARGLSAEEAIERVRRRREGAIESSAQRAQLGKFELKRRAVPSGRNTSPSGKADGSPKVS